MQQENLGAPPGKDKTANFSIPVVGLTQFAIITINIILGILFVRANTDFCGSVFETRIDHALVGNVMHTTVVVYEFECQIKCMGNNSCKSINVHLGNSDGKRICGLNNKTRQMKPGDFKKRKRSTYYCSVQLPEAYNAISLFISAKTSGTQEIPEETESTGSNLRRTKSL
ncbi:uncharacterized protein LOC111325599 isoform X1 [Stylophora pistillata]|uniref:uncharacterized protein LOC111325599 isoform X1 n=1 Tax=Stylophora pistillata TaxID=50429 RepID=UPI000C04D8DE|nr:uncharacterized protein LOC111325599 isoform X1 [Stylophora pistillata]